jgi:hypothetical protein
MAVHPKKQHGHLTVVIKLGKSKPVLHPRVQKKSRAYEPLLQEPAP